VIRFFKERLGPVDGTEVDAIGVVLALGVLDAAVVELVLVTTGAIVDTAFGLDAGLPVRAVTAFGVVDVGLGVCPNEVDRVSISRTDARVEMVFIGYFCLFIYLKIAHK